MTRDACLEDPYLLAILIAANLAIAISYISIPCTMAWLALRAELLPFPAVWWLFGGFILSCGGTHACAALVFFRPAWHLEAAACVATALISTATAVLIWTWRHRLLQALHDFATFSRLMKASIPAADA